MGQTQKYCILQNKKGLFLEKINSRKLNDTFNLLSMDVAFCDAPEYDPKKDRKSEMREFLEMLAKVGEKLDESDEEDSECE